MHIRVRGLGLVPRSRHPSKSSQQIDSPCRVRHRTVTARSAGKDALRAVECDTAGASSRVIATGQAVGLAHRRKVGRAATLRENGIDTTAHNVCVGYGWVIARFVHMQTVVSQDLLCRDITVHGTVAQVGTGDTCRQARPRVSSLYPHHGTFCGQEVIKELASCAVAPHRVGCIRTAGGSRKSRVRPRRAPILDRNP